MLLSTRLVVTQHCNPLQFIDKLTNRGRDQRCLRALRMGQRGEEARGGGPQLYDDMKPCSGAWRHLLLLCINQFVVHRILGVVNNCGSSALLFATAKGASDVSLKSFSV